MTMKTNRTSPDEVPEIPKSLNIVVYVTTEGVFELIAWVKPS